MIKTKNLICKSSEEISVEQFLSICGVPATVRDSDRTASFILDMVKSGIVRVEQLCGQWEAIELPNRIYFYISSRYDRNRKERSYSIYVLDAIEEVDDSLDPILVVSGAYRYGNRFESREQAEQILCALLRGQGCGYGNLYFRDKRVGPCPNSDNLGVYRICTKVS